MKKYLQMANQDINQLPNSSNELADIPEKLVSISLPENIERFLLDQSKAQKVIAILVKDENNVPVMVTPSDVTVMKKDINSQDVATPRGGQCCSINFNGIVYVLCF